MDDPDWAWPAWKFGMKRDDLFTTLHDRYNTFTYTLQDAEAFHHDVYEISRDADTVEQFHRLMADRRQQRLRELNESLEAVAVEIIANPKLMASEQWQHALQLFRAKSYDSIVRYFASYLADDCFDCQSSSPYSSFSETDSVHTVSTEASSADYPPGPLFLDRDYLPNGPIVTAEPYPLDDADDDDDARRVSGPEGPLSPQQSEMMESEASAPSPSDAASPAYSSTNPPSRSMSFSSSESGHLVAKLMRRRLDGGGGDDDMSQPDDCDTAVTSVCDDAETRCSLDDAAEAGEARSQPCPLPLEDDDDDVPPAQRPDDEVGFVDCTNVSTTIGVMESDTPTPRQESAAASCYLEHKPMSVKKAASSGRRSPSPRWHLAHNAGTGAALEVRRSPEEALSKIQKPLQDAVRKRPRGRRWVN